MCDDDAEDLEAFEAHAALKAFDQQLAEGANPRPDVVDVASTSDGMQLEKSAKTNTGYRGVYRRASGRFEARISQSKGYKYVGSYDTAVEAAVAYAKAMRTSR